MEVSRVWGVPSAASCRWQDNLKFNRGKLLNIGASLAIEEGYNAICFHDVDLLPDVRLLIGCAGVAWLVGVMWANGQCAVVTSCGVSI